MFFAILMMCYTKCNGFGLSQPLLAYIGAVRAVLFPLAAVRIEQTLKQ